MGYHQKKQKKVKQGGPERHREGDAWVYGCLKRGSYFFAAFSVGKWTQETCRATLSRVAGRVESPSPEKRIQFFSDGNPDYTYVLPEFFGLDSMDYGQVVKIREKGTVVGREKRIIYGSPKMSEIETTDIENFQGILRERIGRLVRKTKCFSKLKHRLEYALNVFQFYWNFIKPIHKDTTPAMHEGLANDKWTWRQFFYYRVK